MTSISQAILSRLQKRFGDAGLATVVKVPEGVPNAPAKPPPPPVKRPTPKAVPLPAPAKSEVAPAPPSPKSPKDAVPPSPEWREVEGPSSPPAPVMKVIMPAVANLEAAILEDEPSPTKAQPPAPEMALVIPAPATAPPAKKEIEPPAPAAKEAATPTEPSPPVVYASLGPAPATAPAAFTGKLAPDLQPLSERVAFDALPEKEVKRDDGPLGGLMLEWDPFNAEELKVLRQCKAWMSDEPGLFDRVTNDMMACFLRGFAPLVNWKDEVYGRMHETLRWRKAERIDEVLSDPNYVSPEAYALFAEALPNGPIGRDASGHAVCLETPGVSSKALSKLLAGMDMETFVKCHIYNKEATRRYVAALGVKEGKRMYKCVNVVDLSGFGGTHLKGEIMKWFKAYAGIFGQHYPETMYKTYIINAPMIFTGVWKIAKNFIHPTTAAKISVSSWGHEKQFKQDKLELFAAGDFRAGLKPWRSVVAELDGRLDELAMGCYAPPEDLAALKAMRIDA